jgi:hypothetical protein
MQMTMQGIHLVHLNFDFWAESLDSVGIAASDSAVPMLFVVDSAGRPQAFLRGMDTARVRHFMIEAHSGRGVASSVVHRDASRDTSPRPCSTTRASIPLVFDDVTVVDVEHGTLVSTQRVVVVRNRIHAMGPTKAVPIPRNACVVDAHGKYLIPGLWDMHVHTTAALPYALLIANGITGIRDAWSYVPLDTLRQWQREILAGTRVGPPRQLLSGVAIDGPKCMRTTGHVCVTDVSSAHRVVDSLHAAGATWIKTYNLNAALYFAVAAEARRVGLPFGGHVDDPTPGLTAEVASDSGARIVDHIGSSGGLDTLCYGPAATVDRCRRVAERFRQNRTWSVPTLIAIPTVLTSVGMKTAGPAPYLTERAQQVFETFLQRAHEFWDGQTLPARWLAEPQESNTSKDRVRTAMTADSGRHQEFHGFQGFSIMQEVGLPIVAGTDIDVGPDKMWLAPPGFALQAELAMDVANGLTPLHALQSATLNPAQLLQATDSLGTIASGKLADLVLLDANPLVDITNTTTIRAVVANGRYFDRVALDQLLRDVQCRAKTGFIYWWEGATQRTITIGQTP